MSEETTLQVALGDLVIANRILAREDVVDAYGHVSIRNPDKPEHFFLSRSLAPELVERDDILELGLDWYRGWTGIVVYPGDFRVRRSEMDEDGVVHEWDDELAGEAMPGGPVVLSWPDVEASADFEDSGMNLVIHEFAHKLDMRDGDANGCPPLDPPLDPRAWKATLSAAYDDFCARVDRDEDTAIDPYAADSPAEFFAVLSEVFFAAPRTLLDDYPGVYRQLAAFYRQDPAARERR